MDLEITVEQRQLLTVVCEILGKYCTTEDVRRAEACGYDELLWQRLQGLELLDGPTEDEAARLLDLALVAEACGSRLAPVPFVEASVAGRAVSRMDPARHLRMGGADVTFCPRPALDGKAKLVPFGAVMNWVVGLDGDRFVLAKQRPSGAGSRNLGSGAVADVSLRTEGGVVAVDVLATGEEAIAGFVTACDEWRVLMAAALTGLARRALDLGLAYVKERKQFGRQIGAFQSVAHRLADVATEVDGATLLWQEAAWASDEGDPIAPVLARMAFVYSSEVAEKAASTSLHFHGGYGFMVEYDIQLFVRRAKAWPLAMGPRAAAVEHLAEALYGPRRH